MSVDLVQESLPFTPKAIRAFEAERSSPAGPVTLNEHAAATAQRYADSFIPPRLLKGLWRSFEFLALAGIGLLLAAVDIGPLAGTRLEDVFFVVGTSFLGVVAIRLADGYELAMLRSVLPQLWRSAVGWGAALLLAAPVAVFAIGAGAQALLPLGAWFLSGFAALAATRLVLRSHVLRWSGRGFLQRRAVIVGGGRGAEELIAKLQAEPGSDVHICGIFDDRDDRRSPPTVAGYPKLGTVRELVEFARIAHIDMLIVTLPLSAEKRMLTLLKDLWVLPLDIRISAVSDRLRFRPRSYSFIGDVPMVNVMDRPLKDWDSVVKRGFDLVVASLALVVLAPLLIATALAIRLDSPGPALFRQKRHGYNNQEVEVFKFRSLYHDMCDPLARRIVTKGDPRVTRVGRFIRKTSIDELPQLFNVLRGDLSLVGPRPHAVVALSSENETFAQLVDGYFGRHKVKPGITGWAQVRGWRGEINGAEKLRHRVEHDLYYIENWSILLDIYILAVTPFSLLNTKAAY